MGGNVVLLLVTALLALSNGLLATASMMQVARFAPEGVYVAVAGVCRTRGGRDRQLGDAAAARV